MTADRIGSLLARAHGVVRHRMTNALEGSGLHLGHIAILSLLADGEGRTQKILSAETGIEKSSMVLFLDSLEAGGWVRRVRDPEDRRAHIVELTEEGASRFAAIAPRMKDVQDAFLAPLGESERAQLVDLLIKVTRAPDA